MQVPIIDIRRQYLRYKEEIDKAIHGVLDNCNFILGREVKDFETNFAVYCGCKHAVGVASGTDALILILRAMGIGTKDEVITTANSYIATAVAISSVGARPVFVDIDPVTYNIDPEGIENVITKKTKVIMPVHIYGQPADMDVINKLAVRYKLKVVEDACQAHGAQYKGRKTGCLSDAAAFSFYPSKNLGAFGDGGIITTNDTGLYEKVKVLRDCGRRSKYDHMIRARNSRLDTIQAAVLNVKLKYLDESNRLRRQHAALYASLFKDVQDFVTCPAESSAVTHVYHLYVVQVKNRQKVVEFLSKNRVSTLVHYPIPIHLQEAYKDLGYKKGDFPVAETLCEKVLSLPMFPEITEEEIHYTARQLLSNVDIVRY